MVEDNNFYGELIKEDHNILSDWLKFAVCTDFMVANVIDSEIMNILEPSAYLKIYHLHLLKYNERKYSILV